MFRPHIVFFNCSSGAGGASIDPLLAAVCETLSDKYEYRVTVVAGILASQFEPRPDAVVGFSDPPVAGFAAYLLALRYGVPLVISCRDLHGQPSRFLVRKAARIIAAGETMRERLIAGGAPPETTVSLPDPAQFPEPAAQAPAYHDLLTELVSTQHQSRISAALKRGFDMFLSGIGLLGSSPLWLAMAVAVKLDDGGPVFYGQDRVGRYGRHFKSWKFRSMIADADRKFGPRQASEHDPRITRVGRLLRATAMDELPQLWNIFCGDMSFVGPRALLPHEAEVRGSGEVTSQNEIPGFRIRSQVRPGLTGIAQVFAARDIRRRHKFRLDALYVRNQSFWLDIKLVALSFWISFRGKWEHRGAKV